MIKLAKLLFFCSLAAVPVASEPVEKKPLEGCGTIYKCYVPETCTIKSTDQYTITTEVDEAKKSTPVTKDCAAIIRLHEYANHWMHVSIESLDLGISSIVFRHNSENSPPDEVSFECKLDNGKAKEKYIRLGVDLTQTANKVLENTSPPLKCVFEVKLKLTETVVVEPSSNSLVQFDISNLGKSKWSSYMLKKLMCSPDMLKFANNEFVKKSENYEAVKYTPEKGECNEKNLYKRMEYRLDEDPYKNVEQIHCENGQFKIIEEGSSVPKYVPKGEKVIVRCVADAQYFCNYEVNTIETSRQDPKFMVPIQILPKIGAAPMIGEIKCPGTHPIIEVKRKAIIGGEIKCVNHGKSGTLWTIGETKIRPKAAEVRCASELRCHEFKKIPVSSVRNGKLVDHLPKCRETGILKVLPNKDKVEVYCNPKSGRYEYRTGTKSSPAENANFTCEYPSNVNEQQKIKETKEQNAAYKYGGITTGIIIVVVILVCVLILVAIPHFRIYVIKKRTLKKDKDEWETHMTGKDKEKEKEAKNKEKELQTKNSGKKDEVASNNSDAITSTALHQSMRQLTMNKKMNGGNDDWRNCPDLDDYHPETKNIPMIDRRIEANHNYGMPVVYMKFGSWSNLVESVKQTRTERNDARKKDAEKKEKVQGKTSSNSSNS